MSAFYHERATMPGHWARGLRLARGRALAAAAIGSTLSGGCASGSGLPWQHEADIPFCGYDRFGFVEIRPAIVRQGSTIAIRAMRSDAPAGDVELPPKCASGWQISGPARFVGRGHQAFKVDPNAPPGSEIMVGFTFGTSQVERRVRVVGRDAIVLTGTRSQSSIAGCEDMEPVRELEFTPDGFSVTFQPFETYKDYWGSYSYEPASGALKMEVTGGNRRPDGLDLEGIARFENGHLVIEGMFLGDVRGRQPSGPCRYVF